MNDINHNLTIVNTIAKMKDVLLQYNNTVIAYSGGSDSDCLLYLTKYCGYNLPGIFYNTGIEFTATKEHIQYMKNIGFNIQSIKASVPIPISIRNYGYPFISKQVSDYLRRLQSHGFDFIADGPKEFEELYIIYPHCKSALRWWCNLHNGIRHNINWNIKLKEFIIEYGLPFIVADKCCEGAKRRPMKQYVKANNIDLVITGTRIAEGGRRASFKSCMIKPNSGEHTYMPLLFWTNNDKKEFEEYFSIIHSKCYTKYMLKRTGCAGCPFGKSISDELDVIYRYEPKLYNAVWNIFGKSYEWTNMYYNYIDQHSGYNPVVEE